MKIQLLTPWTKAFLLLIGMGFGALQSIAATFTSVNNGNWNNAATWQCTANCGGAPTFPRSIDNVIIANGFTVTLNVDRSTLANIQTGSITVNGGGILILQTNLTTTGGITIDQNATVKDFAGANSPNNGITLQIGYGTGTAKGAGMTINGTLNVWNWTITKSNNIISSTANVLIRNLLITTNNGDIDVNGPLIIQGNWELQNGNTETTSTDVGGTGYIQVFGCIDPSGGGQVRNIQVNFCVAVFNPSPCATREELSNNNTSTYFCPFGPLPITLVSFEATYQAAERRVKFDWLTSSEMNNDYFTLERSADLKQFDEIAQVKGAGNSRERLAYIAYDENPLSGLAYYRLKQTDFNGQFSYSKTVAIDNGLTVTPGFWVAPNPSNGRQLTIQLDAEVEHAVKVAIYNGLGQLVFEERYTSGTSRTLNVSLNKALTEGMYWVKVSGPQTHSQKLLVAP